MSSLGSEEEKETDSTHKKIFLKDRRYFWM